MMRKFLIFIAMILVFTAGMHGQRTLAESIDLTGGELCGDPQFAKSVTLIGTVMRRSFAEDEITPSGFVLRDRKDLRYYINIDSEFLSEHFSAGTNESLIDVLTVGKYLRVTTDVCGKIYVARRVKVVKM